MRVPIYTVVVPILAAMAFAQDTPRPQSQQPADKTASDNSKSQDKDKTAGQTSSRPEEMQTQKYSGTLMDASCAGAGSTASADRAAAPDNQSSSCTISASTTQFALKLKDGKTVKFDDVGNLRAQEAFKSHKKWSDSASASKPVRVKAGGVLNGDQLTVLSID